MLVFSILFFSNYQVTNILSHLDLSLEQNLVKFSTDYSFYLIDIPDLHQATKPTQYTLSTSQNNAFLSKRHIESWEKLNIFKILFFILNSVNNIWFVKK